MPAANPPAKPIRGLELWVCWKAPELPLPAGAVILSFMPASQEQPFRRAGIRLISARKISSSVKESARALYLSSVTAIGTARLSDGRTFRKALRRSTGASQWWFHPVACRSSEAEPAFNLIIALMTIQAAVRETAASEVITVGADSKLVAVLAAAYRVRAIRTRRSPGWLWTAVRSLGARVYFACRTLWRCRKAKLVRAPAAARWDVAFFGLWDWSVGFDSRSGLIKDRYLGNLPIELSRVALNSGWFAWLDPEGVRDKDRSIDEMTGPLRDPQHPVVLLQRYLTWRDVLVRCLDLGGGLIYIRALSSPQFRSVFVREGFDLLPLFSVPLLRGFLDSNLLVCDLIRLSVERATREFSPRAGISFLEHYPSARAFYAGIRASTKKTALCAVQHASYNHDKTFLFLDPSTEFQGRPDGEIVPHPDRVFAMGTFGRELFLQCGYAEGDVLVTGSPRHDRPAPAPDGSRQALPSSVTRILLPLTLNTDVEFDMIDAAHAVFSEDPSIVLSIREHPSKRIFSDARFQRYARRFLITQGSLSEDLAQADLVFFTYSTVAEEALLCGIPVWQWVYPGMNGSALAENHPVPQMTSVEDILREISVFRQKVPVPLDPAERARLIERLFFRADGMAAQRIAVACAEVCGGKKGPPKVAL